MPILCPEPSIYPEGLLADFSPLETEVDRRWWVIYTKPRQEKSLARDLLSYRFPFFLPLVPKRRIYRGRKMRSLVPVFSGYLFLLASDEERLRAIATSRISHSLIVYDTEGLISDLRSLQQVIQSDAPLGLESRMHPGRRVRVTSGPFMGLEGTVEACKSGYRLVVGVQLLRRGISIELDDARLEPIC